MTAFDPVLTLLQWAIEPGDPLVYTRRIVREPDPGQRPRHVLMEQGIVDHYILPPVANAMSLSLGLDLAGTELDSTSAELASFAPFSGVSPFAGLSEIALPASGNAQVGGVAATAVVVQHPGDGVEDGHEVLFQTDPPKHEYACFLSGALGGTAAPTVLAGGSPDAGCF